MCDKTRKGKVKPSKSGKTEKVKNAVIDTKLRSLCTFRFVNRVSPQRVHVSLLVIRYISYSEDLNFVLIRILESGET